jgi:predicted nucleic acid-binding protein
LPKLCICSGDPGPVRSRSGVVSKQDALALAPLDQTDAGRRRELMEKYRDLPMDLADAALVRVAERDALNQIFTLDRKHFSIYRPGRRRRFSIVDL